MMGLAFVLVSITLSFSCLNVAAGQCLQQNMHNVTYFSSRGNTTIRVARYGWKSNQIINHVGGIILEEFLGYKVEMVSRAGFSQSLTGVKAIADDRLYDLDLEHWTVREVDEQEYFTKQGVVRNLGAIGYNCRSGVYVTTGAVSKNKMMDYYKSIMPNSTVNSTWSSTFLPANDSSLVPPAQETCKHDWCTSSTRFQIGQCQSGSCLELMHVVSDFDTGYVESLVKNHKLAVSIGYYGDDFETNVLSQVAAGRDFFFYYWVPDPFMTRVKPLRVSFPDYKYGCQDGHTGHPNTSNLECDFAGLVPSKLIFSTLAKQEPRITYFLEMTSVNDDNIATMLGFTNPENGGLTVEDAACQWVKQKFDVISATLVPECVRRDPVKYPFTVGESAFVEESKRCRNVTGDCPPGMEAVFEGIFEKKTCRKCPIGTEGVKNKCIECEKAFFSDEEGTAQCAPCPAGRFQDTTGQSACEACSVGYFSANPGTSQCRPCLRGSFSNRIETVDCDLCPAGSVSTAEGQVNCTDCLVGRYSKWGGQTCLDCVPGYFQDESKKSNCKICPDGGMCPEAGLPKPINHRGYWLNSSNGLELCKTQMECLEGERCTEGQTGHLCATCLPGYSRDITSPSCFQCPSASLNLAALVIILFCLVMMVFFVTQLMNKATSNPSLVYPIILRILIHYLSTMIVVGWCFQFLLEEWREQIGEDEMATLKTGSVILEFWDGLPPAESLVFSVACLVRPAADEEQLRHFETLAGTAHSKYFSADKDDDREALRAFQHTTEFGRLLFWILLPLGLAFTLLLIGWWRLRSHLKMHSVFFLKATEFYFNVRHDGFEEVRRGLPAENWKAFVRVYPKKVLDLYGVVRHADNVIRCNRFDWREFFSESRPLLLVLVLLLYGSILRGVARPLQCTQFGHFDRQKQVTSAELDCYDWSDPLFVLAFLASIFWGIIVPMYYFRKIRRYRKQTSEHKHTTASWALMYNGYKPRFWWWELYICVRKFIGVIICIIDTSNQQRALFMLLLALLASVFHVVAQPFDGRNNSQLDNFERTHLFMWVSSSIVMIMLATATSSIVVPAFILILGCHIGFLIYALRVLFCEIRDAYSEDISKAKDGRCCKRIFQRLYKQYRVSLESQPFINMHPLYCWAKLHGKNPRFVKKKKKPKGQKADADLTDVDRSKLEPHQKPSKQQFRYLVRIINESMTQLVVESKVSVFSSSVFEFVLRMGLTGHRHHSDSDEGDSQMAKGVLQEEECEEPDEGMIRDALHNKDPLFLVKQHAPTVQQSLRNAGASHEEIMALKMEEDILINPLPSHAHKSTLMATEHMDLDAEADEYEEEERERMQMKIVEKRLDIMLEVLFEPNNFHTGIPLQQMQMNMMRLHSIPKEEVKLLLDRFETRWLLHKGKSCHAQHRDIDLNVDDLDDLHLAESANRKVYHLLRSVWLAVLRIRSKSGRIAVKLRKAGFHGDNTPRVESEFPTAVCHVHEEMKVAAERFLDTQMGLGQSDVKMQVVEGSFDQETDVDTHPGCLTLFQKRWVDVTIVTPRDEILQRLGLPIEVGDIEKDFHSHHGEHYTWWSEATCRQHNVYPTFEEKSELHERVVTVDYRWTPQTLIDLLLDKGMHKDTYGRNGVISIEDWVQELRTGQSELKESKHAVVRINKPDQPEEAQLKSQRSAGFTEGGTPRVVEHHEVLTFDAGVQTSESWLSTGQETLLTPVLQLSAQDLERKALAHAVNGEMVLRWFIFSEKLLSKEFGLKLGTANPLLRARGNRKMEEVKKLNDEAQKELDSKNAEIDALRKQLAEEKNTCQKALAELESLRKGHPQQASNGYGHEAHWSYNHSGPKSNHLPDVPHHAGDRAPASRENSRSSRNCSEPGVSVFDICLSNPHEPDVDRVHAHPASGGRSVYYSTMDDDEFGDRNFVPPLSADRSHHITSGYSHQYR